MNNHDVYYHDATLRESTVRGGMNCDWYTTWSPSVIHAFFASSSRDGI